MGTSRSWMRLLRTSRPCAGCEGKAIRPLPVLLQTRLVARRRFAPQGDPSAKGRLQKPVIEERWRLMLGSLNDWQTRLVEDNWRTWPPKGALQAMYVADIVGAVSSLPVFEGHHFEHAFAPGRRWRCASSWRLLL